MDLLRRKGTRNKSNRKEDSTRKDSPEKERQAEPLRNQEVEPVTPESHSAFAMTENSSGLDGDSKITTEVHSPQGKGSKGPWFTSRQIHLFKKPPPAEEAAYSGPPLYDWVDIETSAAIKLQAAFRRKKAMDMMEEEGHTTATVRNLARRRRAAKAATSNPAQDFVNIFNCCGVDLGLGGGNQETYWDITRELEKARYYETNREKAEKEQALIRKYQRKPPQDNLVENVEVVQ